ncbi:unnamed protein product, partial [Nesidiocoris tenuis]
MSKRLIPANFPGRKFRGPSTWEQSNHSVWSCCRRPTLRVPKSYKHFSNNYIFPILVPQRIIGVRRKSVLGRRPPGSGRQCRPSASARRPPLTAPRPSVLGRPPLRSGRQIRAVDQIRADDSGIWSTLSGRRPTIRRFCRSAARRPTKNWPAGSVASRLPLLG